jgi:AmiR/NasT family two-component response regulator
MERPLRVIAADDDEVIQKYYSEMLAALNYEVVAVVGTGAELVKACNELNPDFVVTDIKMPDMEGIEAAHKIYEDQPRPIVLISGYYDPKVFERAVTDQIVGYLVKPVTQEALQEQIELVLRRFEEFKILSAESPHVRQALRDRKIVERAKALLMRAASVDEEQAFARIRDLAAQQNQKIATAAQLVIAASEAGSARGA